MMALLRGVRIVAVLNLAYFFVEFGVATWPLASARSLSSRIEVGPGIRTTA